MKNTSTLQTVAKAVEWALFLALIPLFFVIVSPLLPTKDYLTTYAVVSGSMEPTVPIGTLALVSKKSAETLSVGDVVAFPEPNGGERIILHRITEKLTTGASGSMVQYRTKGDNNPAEDQWLVTESQIRGKMISMIPFIGNIVIYARQPLGFALAVGIPAALIIVMQIKTIKEGIDEEVQKRTVRALAQNQLAQK